VSSQGTRPGHDGVSGRHGAEQRPLSSVRTRQEHIATLAQRHTDSPLTTLNHHMDMYWMRTAFRSLRPGKTPGVDGVSMEAYAENLQANL